MYVTILLAFCTELAYKITLIVTAKDKLGMQNSTEMNWKVCVLWSGNTSVVSVQVTLNTCLTSVFRLQLTAELKSRV